MSDFRRCVVCGHYQEQIDGRECIQCTGKTKILYSCKYCGIQHFREDLTWHEAQHWKGYEPAHLIPKKYRRFLK